MDCQACLTIAVTKIFLSSEEFLLSERVNLKEILKLSVENQKGAIAIDCVQLSSTLMILKITLLNSDNTLLSLNWRKCFSLLIDPPSSISSSKGQFHNNLVSLYIVSTVRAFSDGRNISFVIAFVKRVSQ